MKADRPDRSLEPGTVEAMVRTVRPGWRVREATLADRGYTAVYHVTAGTGDGTREVVLKAAPDDGDHGIRAEARLLALLGQRTALPVPGLLGAVDDHDDLPAPALLMDAMAGDRLPERAVGTLPDDALRRLARETGEHLAALHGLDVVDGFGHVGCEPSPALRGGRPENPATELVVGDGRESWPAQVRAWAAEPLDDLAGTRFEALVPRVRAAVGEAVDALDGPFDPALGRIDHGLHNLLVDGETGSVEAVLDWAFTLAVPPAYDLATIEHQLGGGAWSALPEHPDRRPLVREAMLDGYRSASGEVPAAYDAERPLYELLATLRAMQHLEAGLAAIPDERVDEAAEGLVEHVERLIGGVGREWTNL